MNLRPRCRDWLPLSTQQLRLRNLVRIQGLNIEGNIQCNGHEIFIYYTLHSNKDSEAFYMSEPLPQRHLQQKWADIQCSETIKSNANCVCVKVWMTTNEVVDEIEQRPLDNRFKENEMVEHKEPISALTVQISNTCLSPYKLPRPPDKLLFTWAVYFSGLIKFNNQQSDAKCKANSLIFHMNGAQFASPEHFTDETLRQQLSLSYQFYSASVPKTMPTNVNKFSINSPQVSRSSSPVTINYPNNLLQMCGTRYMQLYCNSTNTRRSYNLEKLLKIQKLQRLRLQRQRESAEIIGEIKQISLHCITADQLLRKPRTTSLTYHHNQQHHHLSHSMGRTLSVLLAEQQQINPHTLLRARCLLQQSESLRCKQSLLKTEYETYAKRLIQQKQHLAALMLARQELEKWLLNRKADLQRDKYQLQQHYDEQTLHRRRKNAIVQDVERSMTILCIELAEIYPIERNRSYDTICGIPIPNIEAYLNDARYANSLNITPMALSGALGYIAHLVQMIAVIMNRPLRNPILHEGSRSRIMDTIKDISYGSREFPLYTRSIMPSKPVKYALFLLNQNIAQLCYDITGRRRDIYLAIENLSYIFLTLAQINDSQREFNNATHTNSDDKRLVVSDSARRTRNGSHNDSNDDFLSKSHSSMDINHVLSTTPPPPSMEKTPTKIFQLLPPNSEPLAIANSPLSGTTQTRVCRSVGSYSDCEDDFKGVVDQQSCSYSDSNITTFWRRHQ